MASQEEIKAVRLEKLKKLESLGIELYPVSVRKDFDLKDLREQFDTLVKEGYQIYFDYLITILLMNII